MCLFVRLSVRLSYVYPSASISFPVYNLSNHRWIFTKLGMCIDIVEIWVSIAYGQISLIFDKVTARQMTIVSFPDDNLSEYQWIFIKLGKCIDIVEIWFGIANGQIS